MAEPDYKTTLNKMSELTDLTDYINKVADGKTKNTTAIIQLIDDMSKQIQSVKDNVDNIHAGSLKVSNSIKELIAESDTTQQKKLEEIKKSIELLGQVKDINDSVNGLNGIVSELLNKVDGSGPGPGSGSGSGNVKQMPPPAAATAATGTTTPPTGNVSQLVRALEIPPLGLTKGGYTYGKSKKRGKGRRKRTKKSRKKGSNKK
jgi:polyhydroxyalkanoate synthesis regulator phasin